MARAVFVTYLIAVAIQLTSAYSKGCAVGPEYWCQSFQNAQDCGALRHCTDTVWRYDEKRTEVDSSTTCEWCQKILENTHKGIQNLGTNEALIKSTLLSGCKLLPLADISSKCTTVMEAYGASVLSLMNHQRYNTVCHLMNICPSEIPATEQPSLKPKLDEESKMLCNVIVRATHELHVNQHKSRNEVQIFLRDDCQHLSTQQLIDKCEDLVQHRGHDIYAHVASNVELSKVCDHLDDFVDHSSSLNAAPVHCELCSFVLSTAKYMLDAKHTEDKVLSYIDEQVCSRLTGAGKKSCKELVLNNGKELLDSIRSGTRSMLLCTRFQICLDQILDKTSPIQKEEMRSFLITNFCDKLGSLKDACYAMIDKDTTQVFQSLASSVDGNELCRIFGLCPKSTPLLTVQNLKDDPKKCDRCVKDFTRRKHIAERLVNHSSEFLHHLCGQLPNKDDCVKAIDDSFGELLTFIRSMDPKEICIQLKMCDQTSLVTSAAHESDNILNEEIIQYMKTDICPKLGLTSDLCLQLVDSEAMALLDQTSKRIDPHRICEILDVCPSNIVMAQCQDKCQCCKNKIEIYQLKLAKFLRTIVASTRTMCDYMPARDVCVHLADMFESNVNNLTAHSDSQKLCQLLTLCPASGGVSQSQDQCQTCQTELNTRQNRFRSIVDEVTTTLLASCTDSNCRSLVQAGQQKTLTQIETIDSKTLCQQLGYCSSAASFEPSPIQLRLRSLVRHQTQSLDQRLESHDICSTFGQMKPMCEHLLASPQGHRYAYVYKALLQNDHKLVDDDLREQLATKANADADVCTACKNAVQASKDFWINSLDIVRNVLLRACEQCPSKDQCRNYYNQRFDNIKSYLDSIDPSQFCQSVRLCSSALKSTTKDTDRCSTCVDRLTSRRQSLLRGVTRVAAYFDDICQRFELKPCQVFVQQLQQSVEKMLNAVDPRETCRQIGFCSTAVEASQATFEQYETYLVDEVEKEICSTLGPFESLCKQILRGNSEQIQTVKINYNIRDLMQVGEVKSKNLFSASSLSECGRDRCQCCIDQVDQKKECVKNLGDNIFGILIKSCDYCPSKDQCRQYWKSSQTQFESCVDGCDSKQICTRIGFCNASNLCAKMGVFQEECERVLNKFAQSSQEDLSQIEQHLPHTSVVVLPTVKQEEQQQVNEANATCILCEYMMNILSSYIHQHSTEEEIEASLTKVCQQMPHTLQAQCHDFVDNYGPVIIATLINRFDVGSVCRNLNLCTKQMTVNVSHLTQANVASCGVCDYVSTYVHFALKRDGSEKSLEEALKSVCVHLSSDQRSQCQTLVQLFGPRMRELQLNLGENFCQQLPICKTPMADLTPAVHLPEPSLPQQPTVQEKDKVVNNLDDTPPCMLCHYVVSYLDAVLKNNKSEAAVEEALARVCTILPRKDRLQCNEFVKSYGPVLADLISELADPRLVCRYLGMCQVVVPEETTTKESKPITYGHHQYARIPV